MKPDKENISKSIGTMTTTDLLFLFIFLALFSLVVIDILTPAVRFLFTSTGIGQSLYSLASGVLILFYGLIWGFSKIAKQIRKIKSYEERWRTTVSRAFGFIGLEKIRQEYLPYILASILVGGIFNVLTLYGISILKGESIRIQMPPPESYLIIQCLVVAPLFEELVFRGVYLSSFLRILGRNHLSAALGLTLSSFTFGWIHSGQLLSLMIKTTGGFLLGIVYMIKWRKNFIAAFFTHFGLNLVGIFLYMG